MNIWEWAELEKINDLPDKSFVKYTRTNGRFLIKKFEEIGVKDYPIRITAPMDYYSYGEIEVSTNMTYYVPYDTNVAVFNFKTQEDAIMFKLKWM